MHSTRNEKRVASNENIDWLNAVVRNRKIKTMLHPLTMKAACLAVICLLKDFKIIRNKSDVMTMPMNVKRKAPKSNESIS